MYHMAASATLRDLRNRFPKVRKLVESEGEVLLTERGKARYRLTLYTPGKVAKEPPPKDYMARIKRYQPKPLSRAAAKAFDKEWRGER
jgi:antitoxin (DNA-binding transcriptional repressor) of toxin-antitoxin stability system